MFNKENKSLRKRVAKLEEQMKHFIGQVQEHQVTLHGDDWGLEDGLVREAGWTRDQTEANSKRTKRLMAHLKVVEILHEAKPSTLQIVGAQSLIAKKAAKAKKK